MDKKLHRESPERAVEEFLTVKWRRTRTAIELSFLDSSLLRLLAAAEEDDNTVRDAVRTEIKRVVEENIGRRCRLAMEGQRTTSFARALWQAANEVCPDVEALTAALMKDRAVRGLSSRAPEAALRWLVRAHIWRRRLEAIRSDGRGGAGEHKARAWRKLAGISNDLINEFFQRRGYRRPMGYRCTEDHFKEIVSRIQEQYWNDRIVGTFKPATIEQYFFSYCPECVATTGPEDTDWNGPQRLWSSQPLQEIVLTLKPVLSRCFDALPELQKELLNLESVLDSESSNVVQLSPGDARNLSRDVRIAKFCALYGIDRPAFDRLRLETLDQLETCLEKNGLKEWKR